MNRKKIYYILMKESLTTSMTCKGFYCLSYKCSGNGCKDYDYNKVEFTE